MKRRVVSSGLVVLVIGLLVFVFLRMTAKPAQADWYSDAWVYRASLTFTNSGSAVTNQYVTFALATNSTYAALQANCNDARFTDANGNLLQYFQTNSCQAASTTYHVLMPNIPVGGNLVWFYFGNPNASAGSAPADFTQSSFAQGTVTQGSVATGQGPYTRWSFNEGQGTTANDTGSQGNNGTITSGNWKSPDLCIIGNCLYFDGAASQVKAASGVKVTPTGAKSISFWMRTGATATQYIYDNSSASDANTGITIDINSTANKLRVRLNKGTGGTPNYSLVSATTINDSKWHFVETTWDGTTGASKAILYIDGKADQSATAATATDNTPTAALIVGASTYATPANFYNGFLDELKVFNYARSATQIQAEYASRGIAKGTSAVLGASDQNLSALSNGLAAYYKLDENTGTTTADSSGNGNNGSATPTAPTWVGGEIW